MKQYFSDIIKILATEKPNRIADACAKLNSDTYRNYPQFLYKYRYFDKENNHIDSLEKDYLWSIYPKDYCDPVDAAVNLKLKAELKSIESWVYSHAGEIFYYNIPPKGMMQQKHGQTLAKYIEAQKHFVNEDGKIDFNAVRRSMLTEINKLPQKQRQEALKGFKYLETPEFEKTVEEHIKKTLYGIVNTFRENTLIACLTARKDNQKMWEDYSNNYTGFVIEYKRPYYESLTDEQKSLLVTLLPVAYYKRIPGVELLPFIRYTFQKDLYGKEIDISDATVKLFRQILCKRSEYSSEEEWRIINNTKENTIPFPYISAVYAGYKISDDNMAQLLEKCKKKNLPLYRQTFSGLSGKMTFEPVLEDALCVK